jgi:hypothetical protein
MHLFLSGGLWGGGGAGDDQPLAGMDEIRVLNAVGLGQNLNGSFVAAGDGRQGVIQLDKVNSGGLLTWGSGVGDGHENQGDKKRSYNEFRFTGFHFRFSSYNDMARW